MNCIVVINKQHKLLPQQEDLLKQEGYDSIKRWDLPPEGLDSEGIEIAASQIVDEALKTGACIIFASPVGALILKTTLTAVLSTSLNSFDWADMIPIKCFFNSRREAVEVNGKLIHKLNPEGWELV